MFIDVESNQTVIAGLLEKNTPACFRAGGPSMSPTIRNGETVSVRPVAPNDLRPGAVLLYRKNGRLVLHRLVRKKTDLFFCGDAALNGLECVAPADILGTATAVQREGRTVALNTPINRLAGIIRYRLRPLRRLFGKMIEMLKI